MTRIRAGDGPAWRCVVLAGARDRAQRPSRAVAADRPAAAHAQSGAGLGRHPQRHRAARVHLARALGDRAARLRVGRLRHVHPHRFEHRGDGSEADDRRTRPAAGPTCAMADAIFFLGHRDVPDRRTAEERHCCSLSGDGKGFVAAHTALTAFETWPEFGELLGGRYDGHPWHAPGTIINEAADFPATRHFPPTFAFNDEFYQAKAFSRRMRACCCGSMSSKMPPHAELRNDGDFPLAWAKTYGKGRVFYSSLAHDAATWDNRDIAQMYFEAIKWALGMSEGDVTPRKASPGAQ